MSVQLEALADEVFDAAAAQARLGSQSRRLPYGEAIWNPNYPDLYFLNGIGSLVAPDWSVNDLEQGILGIMPGVRAFRAISRDPQTIASLGPKLSSAGYEHEVRVGMVQVTVPSEVNASRFSIRRVDDERSWEDYAGTLDADGAEHGSSPAMAAQLLALYRWRSKHTPTSYYLAVDGSRAIGHVGLFQHGATGYLHGLFTRPESRRQGAAAALTMAMASESRAMGCNRLTLQCIDDGHLPRYYQTLGFRTVGEQHIWTKRW